jgi:hypothetical protein
MTKLKTCSGGTATLLAKGDTPAALKSSIPASDVTKALSDGSMTMQTLKNITQNMPCGSSMVSFINYVCMISECLNS